MADIKVGMSVTGVAQFKQAMTQSKTAVKALDAELKLNEAQYKATGNAEDYARQKAELLKKQITEQEKVVKAAEDALEQMVKNGVDPADKAFQRMRTDLVNAQTQLTNMQTELKGVGDAGKSAASDTDGLNKSLKNIGNGVSFQNITSGISGITSAVGSAVKGVANLGKAIWNMSTDAAEWADEATTMADRYEIDRELYLKMSSVRVEGLEDVSANDILAATDKMFGHKKNGAIVLGEGLQYTITGDRIQTFFGVMDRINQLESNGTIESAADAMEELFGRSFRKTANFNYDSYMKLLESVEVLDEEGVDNLLSFSDALTGMNASFDEFKKTVSADLAPGFEKVAGAIETVFTSLTEWANSEEGKEALDAFATNIADIITDFADTDWKNLMEGATDAINGVVGALQWIKDNKDEVKTWTEIIAGGFAGLKAIQVSSSVLQLINGLTTLGGGAGIAAGLGELGLALGAVTLTVGAVTVLADTVMTYMDGHTADDESTPEFDAAQLNSGMARITDSEGNTYYLPDPKDTGAPGFVGGTYTEEQYNAALHAATSDPGAMIAVQTAHGAERGMAGSKYISAPLSLWDEEDSALTDFDDEIEEVNYTVQDFRDSLDEGASMLRYFTAMLVSSAGSHATLLPGYAGYTGGDTTTINGLTINGATDPIAMYRELAQQGLVLKAGYGS